MLFTHQSMLLGKPAPTAHMIHNLVVKINDLPQMAFYVVVQYLPVTLVDALVVLAQYSILSDDTYIILNS